MEIKMKERLKGNGQFGMLRKVEALYERVTKILSVKASEIATTNSIPYETLKVYKVHTMAVELRRSQALAAAQRQNLRCR